MAYSIDCYWILYKNTVSKEAAMIRIVCPFCHSPLNATDLETATLGERLCLVCPECAHVLLMDAAAQAEVSVSTVAVVAHA